MLKIKNVTVKSDSQSILKDINLTVQPSEIHAIIGPKHSGKSALAHCVTGHPGMEIVEGSITLNDKNLLELETDQRVKEGIFVSFQVPLEFNMSSWDMAKLIFPDEDADSLKSKLDEYSGLLGLPFDHEKIELNGGSISVSQAKRIDFMYMLMTSPKLIILDEIDDELEENEIFVVAAVLKQFLDSCEDRSCIVVSSSKTLLDILKPTHVHVVVNGEIKMSGDEELYKRIVEDGYSEFS